MLATLSALLPIGLYLILMRAFDAFSMVRWRTILHWLLWGAASALCIWGCVKGMQAVSGQTWQAVWISPLLEETVKLLPLYIFIRRRRVAFLAETLLLGQAIGGGFAMMENIIYLQAFPDMQVLTAVVRGFGTTMLHMGCTALAASSVLSWLMYADSTMAEGRLRTTARQLSWFLALPSVGIHVGHNSLGMNPMTQMLLVVVVFFVFFYLLSLINERLIIRWLDVSINDDIKLIAAIREGCLAETKAGQYLCSLRELFDPLVFFDMTAYMLLYLQLTVAAKSRMMLHDAGLDMPLSEDERQLRREQLTELHTLAKRIPRMGHAMLQPLIHASDQNLRAFNELR